jgi:prophage maintenance system killer protein
VSVEYLDLADYVAIAQAVTGLDLQTVPDGNKRAAWVSLRLFVDINGWAWTPKPSVGEAEQAVLSIAAGDWDEADTARWLRAYLRPAHTG